MYLGMARLVSAHNERGPAIVGEAEEANGQRLRRRGPGCGGNWGSRSDAKTYEVIKPMMRSTSSPGMRPIVEKTPGILRGKESVSSRNAERQSFSVPEDTQAYLSLHEKDGSTDPSDVDIVCVGERNNKGQPTTKRRERAHNALGAPSSWTPKTPSATASD